jgi:hypothetical protein
MFQPWWTEGKMLTLRTLIVVMKMKIQVLMAMFPVLMVFLLLTLSLSLAVQRLFKPVLVAVFI